MLLRKSDELQDLLEGFSPEPQIEAETAGDNGNNSLRKVKKGVSGCADEIGGEGMVNTMSKIFTSVYL